MAPYDYPGTDSTQTTVYISRAEIVASGCAGVYHVSSNIFVPKWIALDGSICVSKKAMDDWNAHLRSKACWELFRYANPAGKPLTRKPKKKKIMTAMSSKQRYNQKRKSWI